eukprot:PhF_6_TR40253/c0_g1_i1/m.59932
MAAAMEGMEMGPTSDPAYPGLKTLENINTETPCPRGTILLNSPRSVQACLGLGLVPHEFVKKTQQDIVKIVLAERGPHDDPEIIKMRLKYHDQRRKEKLYEARQARNKLVRKDDHAMRMLLEGEQSLSASSHSGDLNTSINSPNNNNGSSLLDMGSSQKAEMVVKEEMKLQKIIAASESRYKQQLLHLEMGKKRRQEREQAVALQNEREQARQAGIKNRMLENDRAGEIEQRQRAKVRELERRQQIASMEMKLASYERKEQVVNERIEYQKKEKEIMNKTKKERNEIRQKTMQQQALENQMAKRQLFEHRWVQFEEAQENFKQRQFDHHQMKREEAAEKQRHISEAVERAKLILENQTRQTLLKEMQAEERIRLFQQTRMEYMEQKRVEDISKELKRQQIFEDSLLMQKEKVTRLKHKMMMSEKHMEQVQQRREQERREHHEREREKQMDKMDKVERIKRLQERERSHLLEHIEQKDTRVMTMKEQQEDLKEKRRMHRMKVEAMRISFKEATPGPGEYSTDLGTTIPHSPQWKFGLPATAHAMRVVSKGHVPEGVVTSPGPAAYASETALDRALHHSPAFSVPRGDRFPQRAKSPIEVTPGPGEYTA